MKCVKVILLYCRVSSSSKPANCQEKVSDAVTESLERHHFPVPLLSFFIRSIPKFYI